MGGHFRGHTLECGGARNAGVTTRATGYEKEQKHGAGIAATLPFPFVAVYGLRRARSRLPYGAPKPRGLDRTRRRPKILWTRGNGSSWFGERIPVIGTPLHDAPPGAGRTGPTGGAIMDL